MARVQPGDTVVVAFLDRFSRNFEEGVAIQADFTRWDIAIVALREQIDTREDRAAANFFRRAMLAQGAYQVESASARIRMGLEGARAGGKSIGRPPSLSAEQVEQCRRMAEEGAKQATDRPGPQLLTLDGEEGACQLRSRDGGATLVSRYLLQKPLIQFVPPGLSICRPGGPASRVPGKVRRYLAEGPGAPCGTGFRRDPGRRGRRRFPDPRFGPRCPAVSRPGSPGP